MAVDNLLGIEASLKTHAVHQEAESAMSNVYTCVLCPYLECVCQTTKEQDLLC